jgi:[acyl-carrier-protein] S-malonyltransferase
MATAFVFPGQGSQSVGMGGDWLGRSDLVKQTFDEADEALGEALSETILQGPIEELTKTENTQPALLTVSVAYARVLAAEGLAPDVVAGHSLGEYSALVAAGAMAFDDAVRVTRLRGQAMQSAVPLGVGTMAAVIGQKDPAVIEDICARAAEGQVCEPAAFNTPGQIVIAGHVEAIDRAVALLKEEGKGVGKKLTVSAPFHCSLLTPAGEALGEALADVAVQAPSVPYVPNTTGQWTEDATAESIKAALVDQVSKPVLWQPGMEAMTERGVDRWIEVGSGRTLVGLVKRFNRKTTTITFESEGWRA